MSSILYKLLNSKVNSVTLEGGYACGIFIAKLKVKFLSFCCFLSFVGFIFEQGNSVNSGGIPAILVCSLGVALN